MFNPCRAHHKTSVSALLDRINLSPMKEQALVLLCRGRAVRCQN